jgi:hypothetical protein
VNDFPHIYAVLAKFTPRTGATSSCITDWSVGSSSGSGRSTWPDGWGNWCSVPSGSPAEIQRECDPAHHQVDYRLPTGKRRKHHCRRRAVGHPRTEIDVAIIVDTGRDAYPNVASEKCRSRSALRWASIAPEPIPYSGIPVGSCIYRSRARSAVLLAGRLPVQRASPRTEGSDWQEDVR